ncbi:Ubiquitin carboxyl-terminal hydrolase 3-like protein [Drosera capensis]
MHQGMSLLIHLPHAGSLAGLFGDFNFNSWVTVNNNLPCEKRGREQDAEKRFVMKEAPRILIIHLKRLKDSGGDGFKKLSDKVSIPPSLQLQFKYRETWYLLSASVFQTRVTAEFGHYVCLVESHDRCILFDDDKVKMTDVSALHSPFASGPRNYTISKDTYIIFYECTDL